MNMQTKAFNPQIFLEFLCYSVFASLMFFLVKSGKYLSYVTPRMEPYLYFTAAIMLLYAVAGLRRLFRPQYKIRSGHCFVLVIPILFLLLPHSPLSSSDLSARYIGGNALSGFSGQGSYSTFNRNASSGSSGLNTPAGSSAEDSDDNNISMDDPSSNDNSSIDNNSSINDITTGEDNISGDTDYSVSDEQTDFSEDGYASNLPGLDLKNKTITVSNDDFGMWISEIYFNMQKYKGFKISMTGFVFRDPETPKKNEFIPARLMMSCCAADLVPLGLRCEYDKASGLKADSWFTVEGTIFIGKYKFDGVEYDDPQVTVTKITPAEKVEGYVYPSY